MSLSATAASVLPDHVSAEVVDAVIGIADLIRQRGSEGQPVGTIFTIGDEAAVLAQSRPMILDPTRGHPETVCSIFHEGMRRTLCELAALDGAFVLSHAGDVVAAARGLDIANVGSLPMGLGSRHMAAASISRSTEAVAVVLSQSGPIRVFRSGSEVYLDPTGSIPMTEQRHRRGPSSMGHTPPPAPADPPLPLTPPLRGRRSRRRRPGVPSNTDVGPART